MIKTFLLSLHLTRKFEIICFGGLNQNQSVTWLKQCSVKFCFNFWRNKKLTLFFFSLLPLKPSTQLDPRAGVERGLQDLWQEQERLHRGQRAEVSYDDLGPEVDGRGVPGVLEWGRSERRRKTGLQRVHQNHAAVLNVSFVCDQNNIPTFASHWEWFQWSTQQIIIFNFFF